MRKLLNTMHVMTQGAYLHRDGETVAVKIEGELKLRVPVHTLEGLVCWGRVSCSPPVLALCCEHGVGISFLTEHGRFLARVQGAISGNVLLRREQYRVADDVDRSLLIVHSIVTAKIANSRITLLRAAREVQNTKRQQALRGAADRLSWIGLDAMRSTSIKEARGHEGVAGQAYFAAFDAMIVGDRETFRFNGRTRRPPEPRARSDGGVAQPARGPSGADAYQSPSGGYRRFRETGRGRHPLDRSRPENRHCGMATPQAGRGTAFFSE